MITQLEVQRFKSVRHLKLDCRRVNLFIGEPNTGKSSILEALGLLSWAGSQVMEVKSFVRFQHVQNLFYDNLTDERVRIACVGKPQGELSIHYQKERFLFRIGNQATSLDFKGQTSAKANWDGGTAIRFYRYRHLDHYPSAEPGPLFVPDGTNLFSVVYAAKALREWATELLRPYGLAVVFEPHERAIKLLKQQDGVITSYPFAMSSETLQRMLFYHVAMASNKDAVLVFEEPEAHAFPYYTKHLGEGIAADNSNQYFIATHNPYLLVAVLEKAKKEDVAVFATQYRDYETKVTALSEDQISQLLEADPFLGLKGVLETE